MKITNGEVARIAETLIALNKLPCKAVGKFLNRVTHHYNIIKPAYDAYVIAQSAIFKEHHPEALQGQEVTLTTELRNALVELDAMEVEIAPNPVPLTFEDLHRAEVAGVTGEQTRALGPFFLHPNTDL